MPVQQVVEQAVAAVEHARSLFAAAPAPVTAAGAALESAAQSTTDAGRHAGMLSGELIDRHRLFVGGAARTLSEAGSTDTVLQQHLRTAAAVTQAGARQLDGVLVQTRATASFAATAHSPAAQRAGVQALQTQVFHANSIVTTARQRASAIAGQIHALGYGSGLGRDLPEAPPTDPTDDPLDTPPQDPNSERTHNQREAFKQVYGHDPVSGSDWRMAAALDPHSYDPRDPGVPPQLRS